MRVVQTAFIDNQRIDQRLIEGEPTLAYTADGRLILCARRPMPTDWVNGQFVGDHAEPDDETDHVHGEPS